MTELYLMASHGYPPDLRMVLHSEQGHNNRFSKDFPNFLPHQGSNQDRLNSLSFNLSRQQKEDWKFIGRLLDHDNLITLESTFKSPNQVQGTRPESELFDFGTDEKCALLASGNGLLDMSILHDLRGHLGFALFPQQSLVYPTREFYFNEPFMGYMHNPDGELPYNYPGTAMNDVFAEISGHYSSKNTNRSTQQTMLVPFFEREPHYVFVSLTRRKRAQASSKASHLAAEKAVLLKRHEKARGRTSQKKKSPTRTIIAREKSYLHSCETLLSILVNKKQQQQTRNSINALRKAGPQILEILTQFSATIAGAGVAIVLSVLCRVACNSMSFSASKILSTGLGLGLISLSWAVHKLRDTVVSIGKTSGNTGEREEEMMNCLERNVKDIYFRVVALMTVAVLRFA